MLRRPSRASIEPASQAPAPAISELPSPAEVPLRQFAPAGFTKQATDTRELFTRSPRPVESVQQASVKASDIYGCPGGQQKANGLRVVPKGGSPNRV
jgi:hypothetical protein